MPLKNTAFWIRQLNDALANDDQQQLDELMAIEAKQADGHRRERRSSVLRQKVKEQAQLRQRVIEIIAQEVPALHEGTPGGELTKQVIERIFAHFNDGMDFGAAGYSLEFLERIVKVATMEHGWGGSAVPVILTLSQERSPENPMTFRWSSQARLLEKALRESIVAIDTLSPEERFAQLILSVVLFSGLINKGMMLTFANLRLSDVWYHRGLFWVDLPVDEKQAVAGSIRRVWLDPVTGQLIRRLVYDRRKDPDFSIHHASWGGGKYGSEKMLYRMLRNFLKRFGVPAKQIPGSLAGLVALGAAGLRRWLPRYLFDYATGRDVSYSLSPVANARLMTGRPGNLNEADQGIPEPEWPMFEDDASLTSGPAGISTSESACIEEVRALLLREESDQVLLRVEAGQPGVTPVVQILTRWCVALLGNEAKGMGQHSGQAVASIFSRLAWPLVIHAGSRDPAAMGTGAHIALYENVLDYHQTESVQIQTGKNLQGFHDQLVDDYGLEAIRFETLDGFVPERHAVRANIITPGEYREIIDRLWPWRNSGNFEGRRRFLLVVLGYRCGLRRREALKLKIRDIAGRVEVRIRVRKNKYGSLKSRSSRRWLPVTDLLVGDERRELTAYCQQRLNESHTGEVLLFANRGRDNVLPRFNSVFEPIYRVVREVTGDPSLVYHICRHTLSTMLSVIQEATRVPAILDPRIEGLVAYDMSAEQFDTLLSHEHTKRAILHQTAALVGHSTPAVTTLHYIHLLDWLLFQNLQARDIRCSFEELAALLGYGTRSLYNVLRSDPGAAKAPYRLEDWTDQQRQAMRGISWAKSPASLVHEPPVEGAG
ncbi:MAG: site-specific integrase [Sedimenticola sp.]